MIYLDDNCLLSDYQWGFRTGRSTVSAPLSTLSTWLAKLDAGRDICTVFFDCRKAFDSVSHCPLLEKLISPKLDMHITCWVANYLTTRTQRAVVDGETSSAAPVLSGVPQGSVIGPLCWWSASLYINYLPLGLWNLLGWHNHCWAGGHDNHLTLNPKKCKFMLIYRKRNLVPCNITLWSRSAHLNTWELTSAKIWHDRIT